MKLLFATKNKGKVAEARGLLAPHAVKQLKIELFEPHERGHTAIVKAKARQALEKAKAPVFVEDTAFYLEAYQGFPGVYGKYVITRVGERGIIKLLKGRRRGARFETLVAYAAPGKQLKIFKGICKGRVLAEARGKARKQMYYDRIFAPNKSKKSFAEMEIGEKNALSHRRKALLAFAKWLNK